MQARPLEVEIADARVAALVQAVEPEAGFLELVEGAGEVDGAHQRDDFERPRGGLGQHAGVGRRMAVGNDHAGGAEGRRRAQDGADIVRVGHLVEGQDQGVVAAAGQDILEACGSSRGATRAAMP